MDRDEDSSLNKKDLFVFILIIEGWGINSNVDNNAFAKADLKNFVQLIKDFPIISLLASGKDIGLDIGSVSNKNYNYLCLGTGSQVLDTYRENILSLNDIFAHNDLSQLYISPPDSFIQLNYFFKAKKTNLHNKEIFRIIKTNIDDSVENDIANLYIICDNILKILEEDFNIIIASIPSIDIIAKKSDFENTVKAIDIIDKYLEKFVYKVLNKNGTMFLVSSNGRGENFDFDLRYQKISINPVPFLTIGQEFQGLSIQFNENLIDKDLSLLTPSGTLLDFPVTILNSLKLEKPKEMLGKNLLDF